MKNKLQAVYILFMITMTILLGLVPGHNGDMCYYIACAIEKEQGMQKDALQTTKQVLEKELPPAEFAVHREYVNGAAKNILDFYRIKPLYIDMVVFLHLVGFSYIFSTLLPSLLAYFFLGLLTFLWASKVLKPALAFAVSVLLMLIFPSITLARLSSPDALSNLIMLASLYFIYFEKNKYMVWGLLLLSIWVRMDNFIAVFVILTGLTCWPVTTSKNKLDNKTYLLLVMAVIGMMIAMNYYLENDFWWFRKISYLHSPQQYGRQVLVYYLSVSFSFLMALLIFFVIVHFKVKFNRREKKGYLLLVLMGIFVGRFIVFPSFEERFVAAYYICAVLLLAEALFSPGPMIVHTPVLPGQTNKS